MGIFIKRPLCLFCFCFIGASLLGSALNSYLKLALFCVFAICTAVFFAICRRTPKRKYGFLESAIALIFACVALLQSFLFVDLRDKRAEKFISEGTAVEFVVVSEEYSSKYSTKYRGKLISAGGERANVNAYLVLDYEADYLPADRLLLVGDILKSDDGAGKLIKLPKDTVLEINSTTDRDMIMSDRYEDLDIAIICSKLGRYVRSIFIDRLDEGSAALSIGILTGNSSMIPTNVIRDFRRAGLSHLLAVSGLHLSVLLGAIELVLMKLCVPKSKRCIIITVLSVGFLSLAGFSLSACRSVLMLLSSYLCYALSREPDTLTSLSVAGALILFISPRSVGSVSFWLSFLATFGIVVYAEVFAKIRLIRVSRKGKMTKIFGAVFEKILRALIVTVSANIFICIVFWIVFGEMSVISPVSNLLITPLGEAYLILTLLVFVLGGLSVIGDMLAALASVLSASITDMAAFFSRLEFSVVSLEYWFAGAIICCLTLALAVLFIVRLKEKRWLLISPASAAVLFCICLAVHSLFNTSVNAAYINSKNRDAMVLTQGKGAVIIDISDGAYSPFYDSYQLARKNAITEIDSLLLTHYHAKHISSVDRFLRASMVRRVYLPAPKDSGELQIMKDIVRSAEDNRVEITIYNREEIFDICHFNMYVTREGTRDGSDKKIVSFSVETKDGILTYADASWHLADTSGLVLHLLSSSDAVVLGTHGPMPPFSDKEFSVEYPSVVAAADIEILALSPSMPCRESTILIGEGKEDIKICEFGILPE